MSIPGIVVLVLALPGPARAQSLADCVATCREKAASDAALYKPCVQACRESRSSETSSTPAPAPATSASRTGTVVWSTTLTLEGTPNQKFSEELYDVAPLPDGGSIVVGKAIDYGDAIDYAHEQLLLARLDTGGAVVWKRMVPYAGDWVGLSVAVQPSGTPVVTGSKRVDKTMVMWAGALAQDGAFLWEKTWTKTGQDFLEKVVTDATGMFVAGNLGEPRDEVLALSLDVLGSTARSIWVARLDARGQVAWEKEVKADAPMVLGDVVADGEGGVVLVGFTQTSDVPQGFLLRLDKKGKETWRQGIGSRTLLDAVAPAADGWVAAGAKRSDDGLTSSIWAVQVDRSGKPVWEKVYGGTKGGATTDLLPVAGGGFTLVGSTRPSDCVACREHLAMGLSPSGEGSWKTNTAITATGSPGGAWLKPNGNLVIAGWQLQEISPRGGTVSDGSIFEFAPPTGR